MASLMTLRHVLAFLAATVGAASVALGSDSGFTTDTIVAQQQKPQRAARRNVPMRVRAPSVALPPHEPVPYTMPGRQTTVGRSTTPRARAIYDLPFRANDLAPGQRNLRRKEIHSDGAKGTPSYEQKWGYDLSRMQLDAKSGTWSGQKPGYDDLDPKNSDTYAYGQPVYAMGPGTVISCWRNAPENPRPFSSALGDDPDEAFEDRDWLHEKWREKRVSGAGNHLLVEEDDGDLILYAHAKPRSIPRSLCPHDQALYSAPDANAEGEVPEAQRATITAGQFLFEVGNTGNSGGPHLHVHMVDPNGDPVPFRFRRGLWTRLSAGDEADIDGWKSFSGKGIPPGKLLFWPPTPLGDEYARHGFPAGNFQRMFEHLKNSGFWPEWIDAYSVAGKPYLNYVWRPARNEWRAFYLIPSNRYQVEFTKAVNEGYAPWQVESSLVNGKPRYTVVFRKGLSGTFRARHGLSMRQHDAELEKAEKDGLSPVNVSVLSVDGERQYTVLYRKHDIGTWKIRSQIPEKDYQNTYTANRDAGLRPYYVNAYVHKGQPQISAIFAQKPAGARKDRHGMSRATYQKEFESARKAGMMTRTVSSFDGARSKHRYIATWRR